MTLVPKAPITTPTPGNPPSYLPTFPDTELRYPLAGNRELVVTCHDNTSYDHALLLVGLSSDEINTLAHLAINAQVVNPVEIGNLFNNLAGDATVRAQAHSVAVVRHMQPLTELGKGKSNNRSQSTGSGTDTSTSTGKITRKRITEDELNTAVLMLSSLMMLIDGKSRTEILEMSGVDKRLWPKASKQLQDTGQWRSEGTRRNKRYFWNGG